MAEEQKIRGLFWNIRRGKPIDPVSSFLKSEEGKNVPKPEAILQIDPLVKLLAEAVKDHDINLLLLCECESAFAKALLSSLKKNDSTWVIIKSSKFNYVFSRSVSVPQKQNLFFTDLKIVPDPHKVLPVLISANNHRWLLILVHLKNPVDTITQTAKDRNIDLIEEILKIEEHFFLDNTDKSYSTIIVGDFNMEPFDDLMINVKYFNAERFLHYRMVAQEINHDDRPFFYNPMWCFLSDVGGIQLLCGTHVWKNKKNTEIHPHMRLYDQIIYRPQLAEKFNHSKLEILGKISERDLIFIHEKEGIRTNPVDNLLLDHLPIIFEFKI